MARPLRIELAGRLYHTTSRGGHHEAIYLDVQDREGWPAVLGEICASFNWRCQYHRFSQVIDWFRQQGNDAGGGNYQTLINTTLREQMQRNQEATLETTLRKVIREELCAAS